MSRVRDCCDLTGISRIPGGSLTLVTAWFWAISWHGGPVQTAGTVRERVRP
jgi:hypothetical protein